MHPGNLGLFLLWLQNVEICLTLPSTVQLSEMNYLAKSLTPEECYRLYSLLDHRGTILERTSVYGIRRHAVPCINLLAAWLTSPDRSRYKAHENIQLKLRQIGRTDLAHWLGYNTIHQRQVADVKTGARVEESENGKRRHVAVKKATSGKTCPGKNEKNNITEKYDVKHGFWKILLLMLLMLLSVLLFVCCYRSSFVKLCSLCQRFEKKRCKKDDEECWLREDRHGTTTRCSSCSEETNVQRNTSASKFKSFSPFSYFTKKYKRYRSNDNIGSQQIHQEKKRHKSSDSDLGFVTGIPSERNLAQQKMENDKRSQRIDEIKRKLQSVNYDVRCLNLSKAEHNLFISLSNQELRRMGLTSEHVKYYVASDSERKPLLPFSSSQEKNLKIDAFQTKLVNCACDPVRKTSERELLSNLSLEEIQRLYVSESNRNFNSKEKILEQKNAMEPKNADNLEAKISQLKNKLDRNSNTELTEGEQIFLNSLTVQQMSDMNISTSQMKLSLSIASERDVTLRKKNLEAIKEKIKSDTSITRPNNSERMTMGSLSAIKLETVDLTSTQIEFFTTEPERKIMVQNTKENKKNFKSDRSKSSVNTVASNTMPLTLNKDYRKIWMPVIRNKTNRLSRTPSSINVRSVLCNCKAVSKKSSNINIHSSCSCIKLYEEDDNHTPKDNERTISKIERSTFIMLPESPKTPSVYSNCTDFGGSLHDSELSDTYDELGILFSQHMKQQTRPCQRKYCLLGRLLKRKMYHDKKQCHIRHNYYRGYLSDQRPACSSGNVCKDTYDEFNLMYATSNERRQLSNAIHKRRKQFLAQPCVTPGRQVIPLPKNDRNDN